jgi:hypothetical protein
VSTSWLSYHCRGSDFQTTIESLSVENGSSQRLHRIILRSKNSSILLPSGYPHLGRWNGKTTGMYCVFTPRERQVVGNVGTRPICLLLFAPLDRSLSLPYHCHSFKPSRNVVLHALFQGRACAPVFQFNHSFNDSTCRHLEHRTQL